MIIAEIIATLVAINNQWNTLIKALYKYVIVLSKNGRTAESVCSRFHFLVA